MRHDGEEEKSAYERWLERPDTRRHREQRQEDADQALAELLSRARKSHDPEVRAAYATYDERMRMVKVLEPRKAAFDE